MNPLQQDRLRVVIDRGERPAVAPQVALLEKLLSSGVALTASGEGAVAPLDDAELLVLETTTKANVETAKSTAEEGVQLTKMAVGGLDPAEVLSRVEAKGQGKPAGGWTPWFPVIDYDRCTNCMQCLSFCLFGVYDVDAEKQIDVKHPERCKTLCPACSRVCPEVAILFPKYKAGPINGDVVKDADLAREKMKTDISSLLGGDIYSLLRQRTEKAASRFSKERDEDRALKERQRCLAKLKKDLDIPDEVLSQLPTAEAIRARASELLAARTKGE